MLTRSGVLGGAAKSLLPINSRLVFEGDSMTTDGRPSWDWGAALGAGGRFALPFGFNDAVTGSQVGHVNPAPTSMIDRIGNVVALSPAVVGFKGGSADLASSADSPATILANILTCCNGYFAGGAKYVLVHTILGRVAPNALTTQREADRVTLNGLIRAISDPRIKIVDVDASFDPNVDTVDGLHQNWLGAIIIGTEAGRILNTLVNQSDICALYTDSTNLMLAAANPQLAGTSGSKTGALVSGSVATGWNLTENGGMTVVCSKTTLNGATAQRFVVSGTNSTANRVINFSRSVTVNGQIGDQFETWVDFSLASGLTLGSNPYASVGGIYSPNQSTPLYPSTALAGVLRTCATAPLGVATPTMTPSFLISFQAGTVAADITFGRPYLRKVV